MTDVATNPRAALAGPTRGELAELEKEAQAAKAAEALVKPQKLKKGLTVIPPDVEAAEKRLKSSEARLDNLLEDQTSLQEELDESQSWKDRYVLQGAIQLVAEQIERSGRAWQTLTKSIEQQSKLSRTVELLGVPTGQAILDGFGLDVPVLVAGTATKVDGAHIQVVVSRRETDRENVGSLGINFRIPRTMWRPTSVELAEKLEAAGVVLSIGDAWRMSEFPRDVDGGLVEFAYGHSLKATHLTGQQ
jgi:hypothetical protein